MKILLLLCLSATAAADPLSDRVLALGDVRPELVVPSVEAALRAQNSDISAELLLSIAWAESRLEPATHTGLACGPLQVVPEYLGLTRSACPLWARRLDLAYRAGVDEYMMDLTDPRVGGNVSRALLYRACGNAAFSGHCTKAAWVRATMRRARFLRTGSWR